MKTIFIAGLLLVLTACGSKSEKHIFYLHGRIIELQGVNAVSEEYGPYKYNEILDSLRALGATVHAEVRKEDVDFDAFCKKTSKQIDSLIKNGVDPSDITVIGASKGGVMAMSISNLNQHPINYVFLASNNDQIEGEHSDWKLKGRVLAIYDRSDTIAGKKYDVWKQRSPDVKAFKQVKLDTKLGHGFLYTPMKEWMVPVREWIFRED